MFDCLFGKKRKKAEPIHLRKKTMLNTALLLYLKVWFYPQQVLGF